MSLAAILASALVTAAPTLRTVKSSKTALQFDTRLRAANPRTSIRDRAENEALSRSRPLLMSENR